MPVIHEITDLTAPELDIYARLTQAQLRNRLEPEKGIFIAESPKVIARALDAGYQPLSLLMDKPTAAVCGCSKRSVRGRRHRCSAPPP